jgi:hypothetical protein
MPEISIKREEIKISRSGDSVATNVVRLEIPLTDTPDAAWINCYRLSPRVFAFLPEQSISGDKIVVQCSEDLVKVTVDAIVSKVGDANECYESSKRKLEQNEQKKESDKAEADQKRLRELEEIARRPPETAAK